MAIIFLASGCLSSAFPRRGQWRGRTSWRPCAVSSIRPISTASGTRASLERVGQLPEQLAVADALEGNTIDLEGHELVRLDTGYTDTALSTSLHVPSIELVVAGDVAYN